MEFEKDDPITEEARILAQTKKVVLQPADPFFKPSDAPDPIVTAETHANIARDSEMTVSPKVQERAHQGSSHSVLKATAIITVSLVLGIFAGAGYFMFIG